MMNAVELSQLEKTYAGKVRALDGLSLTVPQGCVFALLGPNGAGKSTTMRSLATLTRPDRGTIRIAGLDARPHDVEVRRKIGYVPQTQCSDPYASVVANLHFQGRLYGLSAAQRNERVGSLLSQFKLGEHAKRMATQLSGGMRRRLEIAMGMVHLPSLLLLDEPTVGLDPDARLELWEALTGAVRSDGSTLIFSTHYLEEADSHAHAVAIIDGGCVVAQDRPEALKRQLNGTIYSFEFGELGTAGLAASLLSAHPRVINLLTLGSTVRVIGASDHGLLGELLALLEQHSCSADHFGAGKPTLGDVYTMITSKKFGQQEVRQ